MFMVGQNTQDKGEMYVMFRRRKRLSRRGSKRLFRKTSGFKKKNMRATPMRGGFRI